MKTFLRAFLCFLVFSIAPCFAQTAQECYGEAQRAYMAGDLDTAKAKFKLVLEIDPSHKGAQNYLRSILVQERKSGSGGELLKQLQSLVLPKVEFRDATFDTALDYLKQQAVKQSGGKVNPSFVTQLPAEFLASQKVTLNLANVPFLEAVRYLCEQANVTFSVERFAVVVKPKAPAGAAPPAS